MQNRANELKIKKKSSENIHWMFIEILLLVSFCLSESFHVILKAFQDNKFFTYNETLISTAHYGFIFTQVILMSAKILTMIVVQLPATVR